MIINDKETSWFSYMYTSSWTLCKWNVMDPHSLPLRVMYSS